MQFFTFGLEEGNIELPAEIVGGKGAGLSWMSSQGVPVPPGFIIPTTVWAEYDKKPKTVMKEIAQELPTYLEKLKKVFGYMPLLSVRSGSRVSCPGMMDTILNVGIDDSTSKEWSERLGSVCFGNSLHRLIVMYGSVVAGIKREDLETSLIKALHEYEKQTAMKFPTAFNQLMGAIEAVFKSWDNDRAKVYRRMNGIPREWGTAVTVQAMVFGNLNEHSGTGVLFTRNPDTGDPTITGEFLQNAQGEDIVAGLRTPIQLDEMKLIPHMGLAYEQLLSIVLKLEKEKKDVQDVEFTVQDGKLYLLQTRSAKRSSIAAVKIAIDMAKEGLLDVPTALSRVTIKQFDQAQAASIDPKFQKKEAFKGIPACSGVVSGKPVFSKEEAINCKDSCILITHETTPDDIAGMYAAKGIITMVGGLTSHAAVVARSMNRACIVGVGSSIETFKELESTDIVSMDGSTGRIWLEAVPIISGENNGLVKAFTELVTTYLEIVPVIQEVPKYMMPEALLYLGDKVLHTQLAVQIVLGCMEKVQQLYLDASPSQVECESTYFSMFENYQPYQKLLDELLSTVTSEMLVDLKKRLLVVGGSLVHPFKIVGMGSDLRSLILAGEEVIMDGMLMNDPAIQKVLDWKKSENLKIITLGKYVPGSRSMVSLSQILQLVLKGAS